MENFMLIFDVVLIAANAAVIFLLVFGRKR